MFLINLLKDQTMKRFDSHPHYEGSVLRLSDQFGARKLGFHLEVMDPKCFSAPYHYHEQEEEMFYVIEGEAIVRTENSYRKVGPGDFFFYPTGSQYAHNMYNHTDRSFKFLAIANTSPEFDVCHYPDSRKRTSEKGVLQDGKVVDYFKDEEDPARYWSKEALKGDV